MREPEKCATCDGIQLDTWAGEFDVMDYCSECDEPCCDKCALEYDWSSDKGVYLRCPECDKEMREDAKETK